jgi:hypothetical protein
VQGPALPFGRSYSSTAQVRLLVESCRVLSVVAVGDLWGWLVRVLKSMKFDTYEDTHLDIAHMAAAEIQGA